MELHVESHEVKEIENPLINPIIASLRKEDGLLMVKPCFQLFL